MANVSSTHLNDRDIRALSPKSTRYFKAVGDPKELYIFVNPKGTKKFSLRIRQNNKATWYELKEFREGIYSVAEARRDALEKLKDLEKVGGNLEILKSGNSKYLFKNLFELYIEQKQKMGTSEDTLHRDMLICNKYLLPSLANRDVKDIKYSDLCEILNAIYNPHNPKSRLEIAYRLTGYLKNIFDIAVKDDYIFKNPSLGLKDILPFLQTYKIL